MTARRLHRIVGLSLLLPFLGWIVTALIFYVKPGYGGAYESLTIKTYPLGGVVILPSDSAWMEARSFRTILGRHLCVRTRDGWTQLDPTSLHPRPMPAEDELRTLLMDAFSGNPGRYGNIISISDDVAQTNTGVRVTLNWDRMTLYQRGQDTDLIDFAYRIHYLQWTGIDSVDRILGPVGLVGVLALAILGIVLAIKSSGGPSQ